LLSAVVLSISACEAGTAPGGGLPAGDVQFLAEALDVGGSDILDGLFLVGGSAAAPALVPGASTTTLMFERTRPCREGGTLLLEGSVTRVWDGEAETYDVEGSGTKTRTECALPRGDVVITVDGSGDWTHERHYVQREPAGAWLTTWVGDFDWAKNTGQSGDCSYDLTRTVDTAANTVTLVGSFCGNDVDRSRTWRG
jgi:hypothetical protein